MLALFVFFGYALSLPAEEKCSAVQLWLSQDAPLPVFAADPPRKHFPVGSDGQPGPDCPFYQAAWQVFLYATHPEKQSDGTTLPRFLASPDFLTIEEVFGHPQPSNLPPAKGKIPNVLGLAPKSLQRANVSDLGAGVAQAVTLAPLIDRNGNPIFYAIHMNGRMRDFFGNTNPNPDGKPNFHLLTADDVSKAEADPAFKELEFPAGSIELKSAWTIVDPSSPPLDCFVTKAIVPQLKIATNKDGVTFLTPVAPDASKPAPPPVTVALVALHVVFTLKGHPEFIWSTFEHLGPGGKPDTAPSAQDLPPNSGAPPRDMDFLLFAANTPFAAANRIADANQLNDNFDLQKQSFTRQGTILRSSIFRLYRSSKSVTNDFDAELQAVNDDVATNLFKPGNIDTSVDKRDRYRLVGAVWMDDPKGETDEKKALKVGRGISNPIHTGSDGKQTQGGPDDQDAVVAGEDRLSSTALESFSQPDPLIVPDPNSFPNCFACHDATAIRDHGTPILRASKINVSHILSRYLLDAPSPSPTPP